MGAAWLPVASHLMAWQQLVGSWAECVAMAVGVHANGCHSAKHFFLFFLFTNSNSSSFSPSSQRPAGFLVLHSSLLTLQGASGVACCREVRSLLFELAAP